MKTCPECKQTKELTEFGKDSHKKSGFRVYCKKCMCVKSREYKIKNPEKTGVLRDKWNLENKEKAAKIQKKASKKFCLENPEKRKAHQAVGNALAGNRITRPSICESCFKECKPEAHHEDYSKPLDVEWLCKKCHIELHRKVLV